MILAQFQNRHLEMGFNVSKTRFESIAFALDVMCSHQCATMQTNNRRCGLISISLSVFLSQKYLSTLIIRHNDLEVEFR